MARSIWSGSLTFGLVSIPVALYSATEHHQIRFHQFERGTSDRVRYKRVNERTGEEVGYDDVVKGHDVGGGEHVIVEQDELAEVAPGRSRSLEISAFVELDEVDPVYFQNSYYLAPSDENTGPYAVLRDALAESGRAGVATFVMRSKEYLALIRAVDDVLVLETMLFADEVRDPLKELPDLPDKSSQRKQVSMAINLVEAMTQSWNPEEYHDTYTKRVRELVDAKQRGEEVVKSEEPQAATGVSDLLSALEASVDSARAGRSHGRADTSSTPELSEASKAELTELARDLGISGRSKMNRDELEDAVKKAQKKAA